MMLIKGPSDISQGLESWCEEFNSFIVLFFFYMKFLLSFILVMIGILTIFKLRGVFVQERMHGDDDKMKLKKARLVLGAFYISIGMGILGRYFTYFLIFTLEPLPDRIIFNYLTFNGDFDAKAINRIEEIEKIEYPHEASLYYSVAMVSFVSLLDIFVSVWMLVNNNKGNPKTAITMLMSSVIIGILVGFTTCLPLLL